MSELNEAQNTPRPQKSVLSSNLSSDAPSYSQSQSQPPFSSASAHTALVEEQNLLSFLKRLNQWASDHDTSTQFRGKVGLLGGTNTDETFQLGKSVKCVITHDDYPGVRKHIVIRLFPPRAQDAKYALVVRCGAGWMSARDFFNKEHLLLLKAERKKKALKEAWIKSKVPQQINAAIVRGEKIKTKVRASVPVPEDRNSVAISPVFHPFLRLPQELQDMIWVTAAGLTGMYRPCRHRTSDYPVPHIHENFYTKPDSAITLSTMLRVSKALNTHMASWVYRTTQFHFELTGFTNFLWISGPKNRANLRRVTFKFSSLALLHCLRWLAPDPVFSLFDPPAYTSPHGLQYFWRCQIQDLARELHLHTLTLDLHCVPREDVAMIVRILRHAFGGVESVRFQINGKDIDDGHDALKGLEEKKSWRVMCREWFNTYQAKQGYMSDRRRGMTIGELEKDMDADKCFFDCVEDGMRVEVP